MRHGLILVVLMLSPCLHLAAQDSSCVGLAKQGINASRAFLEEQNTTRRSPCITVLIDRLGQARDVEAVGVLVGYLNYLDPATAASPGGGADVRPRYPAVTALFEIGKAASQEVLVAIERSHDLTIRRNATLAYNLIYRDDLASGIRRVERDESRSNSAVGRQHLRDLLTLLLQDCNGRTREEAEGCKNAVAKR